MEIRKCSQCGGNLKRLRTQRAWICPFCEARYEDETQENAEDQVEYYGLNPEVFQVEKDLSKVMKKEGGSGCIKSIVHCMKAFETAKQVEEYMTKKLTFSDDISVKGVREEAIQNAMPVLQTVMETNERVIVYGNKGIFSKGKEYFVVTDKRSIFVNKKKVKSVLHVDIDTLRIEDCANCSINTDYEKGFVSLDGNGRFQGAMLAMITMLAFEEDPDRDRIRLV